MCELFVKKRLLILLCDVKVLFVLILFCIRLSMFVGRLVVFYSFIIFCVIIGVKLFGLNIIVLFVIRVGIMCLFGR